MCHPNIVTSTVSCSSAKCIASTRDSRIEHCWITNSRAGSRKVSGGGSLTRVSRRTDCEMFGRYGLIVSLIESYRCLLSRCYPHFVCRLLLEGIIALKQRYLLPTLRFETPFVCLELSARVSRLPKACFTALLYCPRPDEITHISHPCWPIAFEPHQALAFRPLDPKTDIYSSM